MFNSERHPWRELNVRIVEMIRIACIEQQARHPLTAISQVSIWSAEDYTYTVVSFETEAHAEEAIRRDAAWCRSRGLNDSAADLERQGIAGNPADFIFANAGRVNHSDLTNAISEDDSPEASVEACLREVRRICSERAIFSALPNKGLLWIGSSSRMDWYDHVEQIRTTTNL